MSPLWLLGLVCLVGAAELEGKQRRWSLLDHGPSLLDLLGKVDIVNSSTLLGTLLHRGSGPAPDCKEANDGKGCATGDECVSRACCYGPDADPNYRPKCTHSPTDGEGIALEQCSDSDNAGSCVSKATLEAWAASAAEAGLTWLKKETPGCDTDSGDDNASGDCTDANGGGAADDSLTDGSSDGGENGEGLLQRSRSQQQAAAFAQQRALTLPSFEKACGYCQGKAHAHNPEAFLGCANDEQCFAGECPDLRSPPGLYCFQCGSLIPAPGFRGCGGDTNTPLGLDDDGGQDDEQQQQQQQQPASGEEGAAVSGDSGGGAAAAQLAESARAAERAAKAAEAAAAALAGSGDASSGAEQVAEQEGEEAAAAVTAAEETEAAEQAEEAAAVLNPEEQEAAAPVEEERSEAEQMDDVERVLSVGKYNPKYPREESASLLLRSGA